MSHPTLRDAVIYDRHGVICMFGRVYGDARFVDGEKIHTSAIRTFDLDAQTISTRNTTYRVEPWPEPLRCPYCLGVFAHASAADPALIEHDEDDYG